MSKLEVVLYVNIRQTSLFSLPSYNIVQKVFVSLALFYWWGNGGFRRFSPCQKTWFHRHSHMLAVPHSKVAKCMKMLLLTLYSHTGLCRLSPVHFRVQPCYHGHQPMLTKSLRSSGTEAVFHPAVIYMDMVVLSSGKEWKFYQFLSCFIFNPSRSFLSK